MPMKAEGIFADLISAYDRGLLSEEEIDEWSARLARRVLEVRAAVADFHRLMQERTSDTEETSPPTQHSASPGRVLVLPMPDLPSP